MGMVKNRSKNGDHYWVSAYVTPIVEDGKVVEYQSVRTRPEQAWVDSAEQVYAALHAGRTPRPLRWRPGLFARLLALCGLAVAAALGLAILALDRKSTRLNSSHVKISYAVFCLKKKKTLG